MFLGECVFFSAPLRFSLRTPENSALYMWVSVFPFSRFGQPLLRIVNFSFARFDVDNVGMKKLDCLKRGWAMAGRARAGRRARTGRTGERARTGEWKGVRGRGRKTLVFGV